MSVIDNDKISDLIKDCARQIILPRFQALADHEIDTKTGPRDLVTQADIQAEAFLEKHLPDLYPGSIVIGEEGISRGDHSLDVLAKPSREPVWVIDPVDGTFNFVHGKEEFGVMLAYIVDGQVQHAWIYDPLKDRMHVAEKGAGAYCNDQRHRVSQQTNPSEMIGHVSRRFFPDDLQDTIEERMQGLKSWRTIGAAAHEYTRIAAGQSDVSVYSRLKPWDHLPGSLIVTEAGGYIAKWNGQPYELSDQYAGLIVTNSKESWDNVFELIFSGFDISKYG